MPCARRAEPAIGQTSAGLGGCTEPREEAAVGNARIVLQLGVVGLVASVMWAPSARGYEQYKNPSNGTGNCSPCHGSFTNNTSPKGTNFGSASDKHQMHRSSSFMGTTCNLCHSSSDGCTSGCDRSPFIGSSAGTGSNPGLGCMGCHGRDEDAGNDTGSPGRGAGLRQHHDRNGVSGCRVCHSDANPASYTPVAESTNPRYYGTADTNAANPCNLVASANTNENWSSGDFLGLDNDGNNDYDAADVSCASVTTTTGAATTTTTLPDNLLTGKKLLLKDKPGQERKRAIVLLSKDSGVTLGSGNGTADDPTQNGGSLRVFSGTFDDTYPLGADRWKYLGKAGKNKGYKFKPASPIKSVLVKPGKLVSVVAKGSGLGHSLAANPAPVGVVLTLGSHRYCMTFGGTVTFKEGKKFLAKDAEAGTCPAPGFASEAFLD